jgi:hypothetical protein
MPKSWYYIGATGLGTIINYCSLDISAMQFSVPSVDVNYCSLDISAMQFSVTSTDINYCPLDTTSMQYQA